MKMRQKQQIVDIFNPFQIYLCISQFSEYTVWKILSYTLENRQTVTVK